MCAKKSVILACFSICFVNIVSGIQNCAVWSQISPCTCKVEYTLTTVTCERMSSFADIVNILRDKFLPSDRMALVIAHSNLHDLSVRSFQELDLKLEKVNLNFVDVNFSELEALSFSGLGNVNFLSLSDNTIHVVPEHLFIQTPNVKTLDLGRTKLKYISERNFRHLPYLETLILPANHLIYIEKGSIPSTIKRLHIARDSLRDLNGTIRELTDLHWLFINQNDLTSLEGELPKYAEKLGFIHASHNQIEKLPQEFKNYPLESLFFEHNLISRFDGVLSKSRKLMRIQFEHNKINMLTPDDFAETENLGVVMLGYNHLSSFNGSLQPLKKLMYLNVSHNLFSEFSLQEITGLPELKHVDISHNRLTRMIGLPPNLVEWETGITHLYLDHNRLASLNGSLSGLRNLQKLYLNHNKISRILPDDLIGLDQLQMLDISYNQLTTLEETSKTFLPALEELIAHHNYLRILERDFHGLPTLCWADLSSNRIIALGRDLVSKTHCKDHSIHVASWGTLKIYLQDNPILCDASLPEIMAEFEVNHTRISGTSHCPPLSEQPVTTRPSAYLGYIPEVNNHPYNVPTYIENQSQQRQTYIHTNVATNKLNTGVPYENEGSHNQNEPLRPKIDEPYFVPIHQNQYKNVPNQQIYPEENGNTKSNVLSPVPNLSERLTIPLATAPIQEQPIRLRSTQPEPKVEEIPSQGVNNKPAYHVETLQEKQMNQFATQIEELRSKVEELVEQNQQLVQNLNQILPHQIHGNNSTQEQLNVEPQNSTFPLNTLNHTKSFPDPIEEPSNEPNDQVQSENEQ